MKMKKRLLTWAAGTRFGEREREKTHGSNSRKEKKKERFRVLRRS